MPACEVFSSPAPNPEDIREAMDALCLEVGEEPPPQINFRLDGDLHPALMLHWRVQANLVVYLRSVSMAPLVSVRLVEAANLD